MRVGEKQRGLEPGCDRKAPLGACPRIGILFKIEKFSKNKHSHMFDIASIIFGNSEEFEQVSVDSERAFSARLLYPSKACSSYK
jgi:hypothetical protein